MPYLIMKAGDDYAIPNPQGRRRLCHPHLKLNKQDNLEQIKINQSISILMLNQYTNTQSESLRITQLEKLPWTMVGT